jgi:hypothetical protein
MSIDTAGRRRDRRYPVTQSARTYLELRAPDGNRERVRLLDLSVAGLAFEAPEWMSASSVDSEIPGVVVQVEDCSIHGHLQVLHVTPLSGPGRICGAHFYPSDETELTRMAALLSGLDAARFDPGRDVW